MTPKEALEDCLGCHARDLNRANIRRSEHTQNDVACTNCHSIHHSATPKYLLAKQQREMCYTCHATIRAQFDMPSKHRVNEGFMQCPDCHNPHGAFAPTWRMGQRPRMVEQARDQRISPASNATSTSAVRSSSSMRRCASRAARPATIRTAR